MKYNNSNNNMAVPKVFVIGKFVMRLFKAVKYVCIYGKVNKVPGNIFCTNMFFAWQVI